MIDKEGGPHCGPPSCRSASLGSSPIAPFDRLFAGFLLLGRVLELALRHPGYEHIARAGKICGGQRFDPVADFERPPLQHPDTGLEVGRASSRERASQDGLIPVDDETLIKTTNLSLRDNITRNYT